MLSKYRIVVTLKPESDMLAKAQEFRAMKDVDSLKFKYNE